jgi:hypothetical protein
MASTTLTLTNVNDKRLGEAVDILLRHQTSGVLTKVQKIANKSVKLTGLTNGVYSVQVDPPSYRAVGLFVEVGAGVDNPDPMIFPIDPAKVTGIDPPTFNQLHPDAQAILNASTDVKNHPSLSGELLYKAFDDPRKAGLLNIVAKTNSTAFGNGRAVLNYIESLTEVRGDRIFAAVHQDLHDATDNSVHTGLFHAVDESMHQPPAGFDHAGSYKTADNYGNLQLTFFSNGVDWLCDMDIDDAQGIKHLFQVVGNIVTGTPTNPYDIHEILIEHQKLDPGYDLLF